MMPLRKTLSFGFEPTFTIPTWWTDPGFVATSDTPLKLEKMKLLAQNLAKVLKGRWLESQDIYQHIQFETFDSNHQASFVVTMDPGSIEVKTPPALAEHLTPLMAPLFEAATESGLVAYRNWWYGVQGGTEGGCHVNMGGFTPESNPLRNDPALLLKYAAFYHNNPWIHFPFMGVDVGPGGNAMRMDEHSLDPHAHHAPGSLDSLERFAFLAEKINRGEQPSADEVAKHLKGTKLAEDKHSAPSFYKFKGPLYLVEDRAVESLRSAEEVELVAELRLRILEFLQKTVQIQPLVHFGEKLHRELLSSAPLWEGFILMCRQIQLDPKPFRRFFDRQFPRLTQGEGSPTLLEFREGRRPR
ncbi:transglutaminase family protein, partial [Bdellovibrionota bacterium FG-1]